MKRQFVRRLSKRAGMCLAWMAIGTPLGLAAEGTSAPPPAPASEAAGVAPMRDVRLGAGGRLDGTANNSQGLAQAGVPVTVLHQGQVVVSTTTDQAGRFAFTGLRGGEYTMAVNDEATLCRLWAEGTAPPSAKQYLQLYGGDVVRGQHFKARSVLTSPVLIGAAIGTAVAVPLMLHNREPQS